MMNRVKRVVIIIVTLVLVVGIGSVDAEAKTKKKSKPSLNKSTVTLTVGKTATLKVKNKAKGSRVTYKSQNKKVAKVSKKGVVKGVKAGKTVVTVTITRKGAKRVTCKCKVTVKKNATKEKGQLQLYWSDYVSAYDENTMVGVYDEIIDFPDYIGGIGEEPNIDKYSASQGVKLERLDVLLVQGTNYYFPLYNGKQDVDMELEYNFPFSMVTGMSSVNGKVAAKLVKTPESNIQVYPVQTGADTLTVKLNNGQVLTLNIRIMPSRQSLAQQAYGQFTAIYDINEMTTEQEKVNALCKFFASHYYYSDTYYRHSHMMEADGKSLTFEQLKSELQRVNHKADADSMRYSEVYYKHDPDISTVFTDGFGVCGDFAKAFEDICNLMGVTCLYWSANNHAWNFVKIDGTWYSYDLSGLCLYGSGEQAYRGGYEDFIVTSQDMNAVEHRVMYPFTLQEVGKNKGKPWLTTGTTYVNTKRLYSYLNEALAHYGIQ